MYKWYKRRHTHTNQTHVFLPSLLMENSVQVLLSLSHSASLAPGSSSSAPLPQNREVPSKLETSFHNLKVEQRTDGWAQLRELLAVVPVLLQIYYFSYTILCYDWIPQFFNLRLLRAIFIASDSRKKRGMSSFIRSSIAKNKWSVAYFAQVFQSSLGPSHLHSGAE